MSTHEQVQVVDEKKKRGFFARGKKGEAPPEETPEPAPAADENASASNGAGLFSIFKRGEAKTEEKVEEEPPAEDKPAPKATIFNFGMGGSKKASEPEPEAEAPVSEPAEGKKPKMRFPLKLGKKAATQEPEPEPAAAPAEEAPQEGPGFFGYISSFLTPRGSAEAPAAEDAAEEDDSDLAPKSKNCVPSKAKPAAEEPAAPQASSAA